ncbi:transcription factor bHLH68-like [Cynara cardunculus var. scolymus]|uniref:Myc-type, basic helix-loop-helix (BHLH) domain-containing protein n=1 Tax=Cynara cardunculus var. scolymus TaxID=59895 RepID=A0A103YM09_CYNCS|nr:transcription factor bHLH68-like [Cynara cardunculus var. scolymus]KVI11586.1 Myc-type, basic helix-loop-helix (bHLH) domain-containing protein [Cynara cardunculus var. scolymus]
MNRGNVLQSSPVQQMLAGGPNSWWSMMGSSRPSPPPPPPQSPFFATSAQPHFFPHQYAPAPPPSLSPWHDNQDFPDSLSQLLMGGLVGEDDKSALSHMQQVKKLENWEEQLLHHHHHQQQQQQQHHSSPNVNSMVESAVKQENSLNYGSSYGHGNADFHGVKSNNWSNPMIPVSSPNSCISSLSNNMLDFSTTISNKADGRHPPPDRSSECNSTATGGASKKAKIQPSSNQSTFKVRKEKLGDRITALHQLVSPFGKTDTASVLLEAIGYIRFLQSQIEALSLPYLGSGSGNMRHPQHSVQQGERNCLFPEDPGQLLNDSCMKLKGSVLDQDSHEEPKIKDLRSRGLCLVPVSCTMQVGSDNGADYWAPALNGGFR